MKQNGERVTWNIESRHVRNCIKADKKMSLKRDTTGDIIGWLVSVLDYKEDFGIFSQMTSISLFTCGDV